MPEMSSMTTEQSENAVFKNYFIVVNKMFLGTIMDNDWYQGPSLQSNCIILLPWFQLG